MPKSLQALAALAAALAVMPISVSAESMGAFIADGVGLPMKPRDAAAGPWTLSTGGQAICTLSFSDQPSVGGVYGADIPAGCAAALPPGVTGWKPASDGLALVGADASELVDFNQLTPRDLVARRSGAPYLELTRPKSSS